MQWYYVINNQQAGPVDEQALLQLKLNGTISSNTLVWNQSFGDSWKKYSDAFPEEKAACVYSNSASGSTPNAQLMAEARADLSGKWGPAVGIMLLYIVMVYAISFATALIPIPFASNLIQIFIVPPLVVGLNIAFLSVARQQPATVSNLFDGFNRYWPSVSAYFFQNLFLMLWILPGAVLLGIGAGLQSASHAHGTPALSLPGFLLLLIGGCYLLITAIIISYRYSQVLFIVADTPSIGGLAALRRSIELMHGHKMKFFVLGLRFIGWILLAICTLGIGFLWLAPYLQTAYARFYDDLK
jgi:uncharacterized membrane protein